nr:uncharacterized protein LOC124809972 [Hydra vulgaris]
MASYAGIASKKCNRIECVIDLNVYMDPSETFNRKYIDKRAEELYLKITQIVGPNKIRSLTYNTRGNWVCELNSAEDALLVNDTAFQISNCKQHISTKIRSEIGLLITVKCDPLIEDSDIINQINPFTSEIYSIKHTTYRFDKNIKDGRRLFRIKPSVKLEEIPHSIEIEGIKIALHFAGKSFLCMKCGNSHPPQQRCISQKTNENKNNLDSENKISIQKNEPEVIKINVPINPKKDLLIEKKQIPSEKKSKIEISKIPVILQSEPDFEVVKYKNKRREEKRNDHKSKESDENESDIEDGELIETKNEKIHNKRNAPPPTPRKENTKKIQR